MINTMRSSLLISAVFVCSLFLSASPIRASESAEPAANVRALLNSGIEAYKSANYQAAESSFSKALEISELSSLKGLTSQSYFWLIRVYSAQNKFSAAEAVSRKQIEQLENSSQPAHRMIDALCNLGFLQIKQKKLEEAKLSFERAKKIGDSKDMESIYVFEPFVGLAILQSSQGNLEQAARLYEHALEVVETNNFDFATRAPIVDSLAEIYVKLGQLSRAEDLYKNVVSNYEFNDKLDQIGIAKSFSSYASLLENQNRLAEASKFFKRAFEVFQKYRVGSIDSQNCRSKYAALLRKLNLPDEAKKIEESK